MLIKKDSIYNSYWFLKFINKLFKSGKKNKMLKYIYNIIKKNKILNIDFYLLFKEALEILRVPLALKKISFKHEVPFFISEYYQYSQGLSWIIKSLKNKNLKFNLVDELILIVSLNSNSLSLKYKKEHELKLYKNRFFKNWS